jgi:hypothetical protein
MINDKLNFFLLIFFLSQLSDKRTIDRWAYARSSGNEHNSIDPVTEAVGRMLEVWGHHATIIEVPKNSKVAHICAELNLLQFSLPSPH